MHKRSSQPRPECWKPQEITAGSTPTTLKKREAEKQSGAKPGSSRPRRCASDGRRGAKFTLKGRDPERSESGQVDELRGGQTYH